MPKIYWLGTFLSGLILMTMGESSAVPRVVPYFLMALGVTGFLVQSWFEQKRRR
ncbi:hypothetical protein [Exiguobacterium sp. SL-9]|uniref:hypothetical protein n=1 Tax=Exiguobacterium sp. SL-9 TaxID=2510963 RepID=UPI00191C32D4|nr:hypothetical protein [Exiguobacterium sp. SL-9]